MEKYKRLRTWCHKGGYDGRGKGWDGMEGVSRGRDGKERDDIS